MNQNYQNLNGITIRELKAILGEWSEYNTNEESMFCGDECEVWIENEDGISSPLISINILNKRLDAVNKIYSDVLLTT